MTPNRRVRPENQCTYVYGDTPKAREHNKVGKRCGMAKINGTDRCKFHGGATPSVIAKARKDRVENEMRTKLDRFTDLWPESHELLDPFSLMLWEIRRCAARIEWFDERLRELDDEKALWWGETKREKIGAAEFTGTNKTFEARENVILAMQAKERDRLNKLTKEWAEQRFEAARIAGYGAFGVALKRAIGALAVEFALDLTDQSVQARVRRVLGDLPDPLPVVSPEVLS